MPETSKTTKYENNLSKGSVVKQLLVFAIPFIISNMIQSLYNVVDMIIVGQFCGTASMSGVNIGGQVTFLVTNLVAGLCVGGTVLIGQYLGSGKRKELADTISTLFTSLLIAAVFICALTIIIRNPILTLIRTPVESFEEARSYLFITAIGTVFIFGYNALSAVMRGMGDSRNPLIFVSIACGVNIILDLILVGALRLGASGAAAATVASQAVSMILCILFMRRSGFVFDFHPKSFKIDRAQLKMLFKIGIPTSIQNVITNISFLFLTTMVNTIGVTASAAVGAVGKFNGFAILPAVAISSSISAMCAHNIGAGEFDRAKKTLRTGMLLAISMSGIIFIIAQIFPAYILRMFVEGDEELVAAGISYMRMFCFDYLLVPFVFSFNGLFIGSGHTTFSLINGVLSALLIRIPVAYIFGMVFDMGLPGIGLGAPFASAMALVIGLIYYLSGRWKKATIVHSAKNSSSEQQAEAIEQPAEAEAVE